MPNGRVGISDVAPLDSVTMMLVGQSVSQSFNWLRVIHDEYIPD
jgi:hypothetical protein